MMHNAMRVRREVPRDLEIRFQYARREVSRSGFYAAALSRCPHVWTSWISTICIDDGGVIYVNPEYISKLDDKELAGLILHVLHHLFCDHLHKTRFRNDRPYLWNVAVDLEINSAILDAGWDLPKNGLYPGDPNLGFPDNQTAEAYFNLVLVKVEEVRHKIMGGKMRDKYRENKSDVDLFKKITKCRPFEDNSFEQLTEMRRQLLLESSQEELAQLGSASGKGTSTASMDLRSAIAAELSKNSGKDSGKEPGKIPGGITRIVAEMYMQKSEVDWRKLLLTSVKSEEWGSQQTRWSQTVWKTPDRRFPARSGSIVMPGVTYSQPCIGSLSVVVDTSGSMDDNALAVARNEIETLLRKVMKAGSAELTCYAVDSKVASKQIVKHINDLTFDGGGGTDMRVGIMTAAEEHNWRKHGDAIIVVLTDGYTPWPKEKPDHVNKVVICLVGENTVTVENVPDWSIGIRIKD